MEKNEFDGRGPQGLTVLQNKVVYLLNPKSGHAHITEPLIGGLVALVTAFPDSVLVFVFTVFVVF